MTNPEEAIEKVLAGLRNAERSAGLEGRVLRGIEDRMLTPSRRPGWVPVLYAGGVTLSGAVAMLLLLPGMHRHPAETGRRTAPTPAIRQVSRTIEPPNTSPPRRTPGFHPSAAVKSAPAAPVSEEDSLAMAEMLAPSHPAPPLPLTAQEKLLLRMVHEDDPVELATLSSEVRRTHEAEDEVAFRQFFEVEPKANSGETE